MRGRLPLIWALGLSLSVSCGAPFDREDGRLVILLDGAPPEATHLRAIYVSQDERRFQLERARPMDDIVPDFSALPVGSGRLSISLLAQDVLLLQVQDLEVVIDGVRELRIQPFSERPRLRLAPRATAGHPRWAGPLYVDVLDDSATPPSEPELQLWAQDQLQPTPARTPAGWIVPVDPALASDLLPATLDIRAQVCFRGLPGLCTTETATVQVHRRVWARELSGRPSGAGTLIAERGWALVPDEGGTLWVIDVSTGDLVQPALQLADGLVGAVAQAGATVAVASKAGRVHAFSVQDEGLIAAWTGGPLSPRPSPVVSDGQGFVIADQEVVYALDPSTGAATELGRSSAPIVAPPLAQDSGVVVADLMGEVLALTHEGQVRFRIQLGSPIYAAVVADGTGYRVVTGEGEFITLDAQGRRLSGSLLGAPVVFEPVPLADGWAVAAGRSVFFLGAQGRQEVALGERIIGAPATWPDGRGVLVGLFNGRFVRVRPDQAPRTLSRLQGLALSPRVMAGPARALVGTSAGQLQLLRAEEDF